MPKTILPAACYTQKKWLDFEIEHIFKKIWIFACLTQQLKNENDFVTCSLAGVSIFIQNFEGKIRAFRNSCPHKGMPIQNEHCGNRKAICPYHGWSFDCNGKVRGIPNVSLYKFTIEEKDSLRLEEYPISVIGNFVFIFLGKNEYPIEEQFKPDLIDILEKSSNYFSDSYSYTEFNVNFNWKLNFENVTDFNHIKFVHPKTFAPLIEYSKEGAYGKKFSTQSKLFPFGKTQTSIPNFPPRVKDLNFWGRAPLPYKERWYSKYLDACDIGGHFACHIFPNLNFGSIHGENFFLQQYDPTSAENFNYRSWIFTSKTKEKIKLPHLLWGIHHAEKNVINEDIFLLEKLQKTLSSSIEVGYIGDHEKPLTIMGEWYMEKYNATKKK